MKLAIVATAAFGDLGSSVYEDHAAVAKRARWWWARGAEGVVFYDSLIDFYETPLPRFRALKDALADAGLATPVSNTLRKSLHLPAPVDADERRLHHCLEVCGEIDAALAIELHDEGIHDDADRCLHLVDLIDEPNAGSTRITG